MKIAVTSQNRRTVTGHAGRCRGFWLYETDGGRVTGRSLIELPPGQTLHDSQDAGPHPLDDIAVLITGGMGVGLRERLRRKGILAVATAEIDPDRAVAMWLNGTLAEIPPHAHAKIGAAGF